jgi:2-polyprenyl-6-methoxyphenol hydroxylase-like FAD-dependent oxidoreductase
MNLRNSDRYDAIIVGGRPAGAATALLLARRGRRVLVLERAPYGSDTRSTHALMKGGVLQLQRWGLLDRIIAAGTPPITRTVVHYGDDDAVTLPLKPAGGVTALYAPRRTLLDPVLADAAVEAGADVRFTTTVTGLRRAADGTVVGVEAADAHGRPFAADAAIVVGADGARSLVAGAVGAAPIRVARHAGAFVYTYFDGHLDGYDWHYTPGRQGRPGSSAGVIPTNGGTLVWVGIPPTRFVEEGRAPIEPGFRRILRETAPALAEQVAGLTRIARFHRFPGARATLRRAWGPGWALVGDAGSFADPLSAHGLTDALRDAELLARAIDAGLDEPAARPDALAAYEAERDRLTHPVFTAVDAVASYRWDRDEIAGHLLAMSRAMGDEVATLLALDAVPRAA